LTQAVAAYNNALKVYTHEELPKEWARIQNSLGSASVALGMVCDGEKGREVLTEATSAFRGALEIYTKIDFPEYWSRTQRNLGFALALL
jgi:hypothetical protein